MDMIMSPWIDGLETYKSHLLVKRLDHRLHIPPGIPKHRLTPDFAFGCTHKCFMHLKVALSIALIVVMELFSNRSVKNLHLAAFVEC
jgi:hypothetical protein